MSRHLTASLVDGPKAVGELSSHANRIVSVVKVGDGLRGKPGAVERIGNACEEKIHEPSLKPEFVEQIRRIRSGDLRRIRASDELLRDSR